MNIRRIPGEAFHYLVESESKPGTWYYVDLMAQTCTCNDWRCDHAEFEAKWGMSYRCKHMGKRPVDKNGVPLKDPISCRDLEMDNVLEYGREQMLAQ